MKTNENWRAKCNRPGYILVSPLGNGARYGLNVPTATQLRDELAVAIEEAKRLDPFEQWAKDRTTDLDDGSIFVHPGNPGCAQWVNRAVARAIWDAARKAQ